MPAEPAPLVGARARARAEITAAITAEARRQLAVDGAAGLSLRSVARELGMVSSGIYRYVASRDELLTALIVEAYDSLGAAAEGAATARAGTNHTTRFRRVCAAMRAWAHEHRHEWALLYGSPVPGYEAPPTTIPAAGRAALVLLHIVDDAHAAGELTVPAGASRGPRALAADMQRLATGAGLSLPAPVLPRLLTAWMQLLGAISVELFGHTKGVVEAHDELFDLAVDTILEQIGLAS